MLHAGLLTQIRVLQEIFFLWYQTNSIVFLGYFLRKNHL